MLHVHLIPIFECLDGLFFPCGVIILVKRVNGVGSSLEANCSDQVHLTIVGVDLTSVRNGVGGSTNFDFFFLKEKHGTQNRLFVG